MLASPDQPDDASLATLARFGCRVVAVTRGGQRRELVRERQLARHGPPIRRAVDTTGAGDVFHGAYAFAIGAGLDVRDAMAFAAAGGCNEMRALRRPCRHSFDR